MISFSARNRSERDSAEGSKESGPASERIESESETEEEESSSTQEAESSTSSILTLFVCSRRGKRESVMIWWES